MQLIDHLGIRDGHRNLTFLGGDWGFLGGASVLKDRPGGESGMYYWVALRLVGRDFLENIP